MILCLHRNILNILYLIFLNPYLLKAFKNNKSIICHSDFIDGHAYHLYIIEVEKRNELYEYLKSNEIFCQVHYIPVYKFPYYRSISSEYIQLENAENYYRNCLSLPMYPSLSFVEQSFVIESILSYLR